MKKFLNTRNIISLIVIVLALTTIITMIIINKKDPKNIALPKDTITYKGKKYVYLEYNADVFYYDYNNPNNDYFEVDEISPINHEKWDMIFLDGDLFIHENQVKEATKYYSDDKNYEWSIVIENGEKEKTFPISLTESELEYLYNLENFKKEETISFEDIKKFGTLTKTSKDKTVSAVLNFAYCNNYWYWKTEKMTDSKEENLEYVIKLPKTLNNKIEKLQK